MDILLSHTSALEAIRGWDITRASAEVVAEIPACLPVARELRSLIDGSPRLSRLSRPLHLLAAGGRGRRRTRLVHAHMQGEPLPQGSILRLEPGVLCASPELVCVQMAPSLTQLELVVLLCELMGLYAIAPGQEDGMVQRSSPLMSPEGLLRVLDSLGARRGVRQVRRALAMACVRSGSPRETKLFLRLSLGRELGGAGLHVLSMNDSLEVRRIHDKMRGGIRKPDLLIAGPSVPGQPRKVVAVEYYGRQHDKPARLAQDVARSNELQAIDVVEFIVRREQYGDFGYMEGLIDTIREKLGVSRPALSGEQSRDYRQRRLALYAELELIDGVNWKGLERARSQGDGEAGDREAGDGEAGEVAVDEGPGDWDVVPVDAYEIY